MKQVNIAFVGICLLLFPLTSLQAQWTLEKCIEHAVEQNYTVKQKMLEMESKHWQLASAKMSMAPSLSASVGQNLDFGRAPTAKGIIENQSQSTTSLGVSLNMPLFEGLRNVNQTKSAKIDVQAAIYDLQQVKENIEMTVTAYYLQVLLCEELLEMTKAQAELSKLQIDRVEKLVKNGRSPESELYTAKAAHAADQYTITEATNNLRLALLDLRQLLNIQDSHFTIAPIQDNDFETQLQQAFSVTNIIHQGMQNRPSLKSLQKRIEMSELAIKMARSGWYPSLYFSASYGTGYYYSFQNDMANVPLSTQFNNNSRGMVSLSLSIPIFDKLNTYHNVQLNKLQLKSAEIQLEESKLNLTKEIEQAYTTALNAKDKYFAATSSKEAAKVALEYEEVKYAAGSSTTFAYNEAKNRYEKAQSDLIQSKYNFLIRKKILEFYGK